MTRHVMSKYLVLFFFIAITADIEGHTWDISQPMEGGTSEQPRTSANGDWPVSITNSQGTELCLIPSGEFLMGPNVTCENDTVTGPDGKPVPGPQPWLPTHLVRISRPFYMAKYELTVGEYERFTTSENYRTLGEVQGNSRAYIANIGGWGKVDSASWRSPGFPQTDRHPVVCLNWFDAVMYIDWLNEQEAPVTPTGEKMKYVLPTEAQWEYACRGKTSTRYSWGESSADGKRHINGRDTGGAPDGQSWSNTFPFNDGFVTASPVGSFLPNGYGLYDMHGNVSEWCSDWYDPNYYAVSPRLDPKGPEFGTQRVDRGGGWYSAPEGCTSFYRGKLAPDERSANLGFRIALVVVE